MRDEGGEVLGRGGAGINLLGISLIVLVVGFTILESTGDASLGKRIEDALGFGVLATYGFLTSTTSVRLDGRYLQLVRLFATTRIPVSIITSVSSENGLEVTTADGETYTHIGYGSSLIGDFTGNQRATRVAAKIQARLPPADHATATVTVSRRARPGLALVLVFPPALAGLALALH